MVNEFYCIACEKRFKSEKALSNHEKSKKHKENLAMIRAEMEHEIANELQMGEVNDPPLSPDEDDNLEGSLGGQFMRLLLPYRVGNVFFYEI